MYAADLQKASSGRGTADNTSATSDRDILPENYLKRWDDPAVQKRIDEGIEKNRKADAEITIVDASGKPVAGAKVRIAQNSHAFLFGSNTFKLGQMGDMEKAYREAFLKLFNATTVGFYWKDFEPTQGLLRFEEGGEEISRRPPPDRVVAFAKEHGITMRGHPLMWSHPKLFAPTWMPTDADTLKDLFRVRFAEIARRYAADIALWDVVNESLVSEEVFPLHSPTEKEYQPYVPWAFKEANAVFRKENLLCINDVTKVHFPPYDHMYYQQCAKLIAEGVGLDSIGFQFHYFRREHLDAFLNGADCDPNRLLDTYTRFAGLGKPLHITEITIGSAGEIGEAIQARVVRDLYRLWFSAPNMEGITWWNLNGWALTEEVAACGGLTHEDMSPKPAYQALDQLINHEWKTKLETHTDENGVVTFRGFRGGYTVDVTVDGRTKSFPFTLGGKDPVKTTLKSQ